MTFSVLGVAEPKGSTKAVPIRHRFPFIVRNYRDLLTSVAVTSDNPAVKAWQAAIAKAAWCAKQDLPPAARRPIDAGAVALQVVFYLPRPSGLAKSYVGPHLKKPDLDKLVRAVKYALTEVIWQDDSQVTGVTATKTYAGLGESPRAEITVTLVEPPLLAG